MMKMTDFSSVVEEMKDLHARKNHDYGDAFAKSFGEFGLVSAVVRMSDKMERLKSLCMKDALVAESVRDTLVDLACYAVMTVVELDARKGDGFDFEKDILNKI